ncbi:MAG TPA: aconitate hydratase [Candidatus Marinimicrobia bacterium]|nr:aconitate hydratase [Candidatus Neomarinimicrobiota bacterium]HRS52272.1 aconitate hydratase [Candidatus Neomarinimicrobiota bacterium]HRU91960.1 aconitate hydratase [Candidatus Neomarinimicrobiota bacterium]
MDVDFINIFYREFSERVAQARNELGRALSFAEKIIYGHLFSEQLLSESKLRESYINLRPDRVAMQDATAQMALLQFINAGRRQVAVPTTIHCDHLIVAKDGAVTDLKRARRENREVYDFLQTATYKFGIGFWPPGAGIIHQIILENYAFPGGLMIGADSHTPNAGGLGMLGIGVGGADAVDVMAGLPWELKMPGLIGVELTGRLNGWASPKDVILKLVGMLGTKGATGMVIEYFGNGTANLSCTGKATICNMGAECGATASIFPYDAKMAEYLNLTGRAEIAKQATAFGSILCADPEVYQTPQKYFDRVIEIDLDNLEPYVNGPFSPDAAVPLSQLSDYLKKNGYPAQLSAGLIGSCTNSSYEDLSRAADVARQANNHKIATRAKLIVNPGSQWVKSLCEKAGFLNEFRKLKAQILANACGPCIGQWERDDFKPGIKNSIITSFNRNFAGRNDGNQQTHTFLASPEIVLALTLAGDLNFNPSTDFLISEDGKCYQLEPPKGEELPAGKIKISHAEARIIHKPDITIKIDPRSQRLRLLEPFPAPNSQSFQNLLLLMKVKGKCTTDHISPAGEWLKYRGNLDKISDNLLLGARNAFTGKLGETLNQLTGEYAKVATVARSYQSHRKLAVIVADENYGEGSSREHAAMEPRYLGVVAVIARSFARIHETNLKKQGVLALTFTQAEDYERIQEDDEFSIKGLEEFAPGRPLDLIIRHKNGESETIQLQHSYSQLQIEWFWAGSALNYLRLNNPQKL